VTIARRRPPRRVLEPEHLLEHHASSWDDHRQAERGRGLSIVGDATKHIRRSVTRRIFTLKVSYQQALLRVQGDPTRGLSKNPAFLQSMLVKFERALPFLARVSTVIDADALTLDDVVRRVVPLVAPANI